MVENVSVRQLKHGQLTIEGYSRAAVQTYWRLPELKLGFDLGAHPWEFMGTPTWFLSHMHLDHMAALPIYVARRRLMKMDPPTVYLPEYAIESVKNVFAAFGKLDRGRLPCNLIGVKPGQEIELSRELVVTVTKTVHTIPSVGFIVWHRRQKLLPEYTELSGNQIRDIRKSGGEVTSEMRDPVVAYLGDSSQEGLDNCDDFFKARILICEMTFVAPWHRPELIHKNGHMHLDDFVQRKEKFQNELIIAGHLSTRYHPNQAVDLVKKAFPDMLGGRLHLWI